MNRAAVAVAFIVPVVAICTGYAWDELFGAAFATFGNPANYGLSRPALVGIPICVIESIIFVPSLWKANRVRLAVGLFAYLILAAFAALALGMIII